MGLKSVLFSGILLSAMAVGVQATPETGSGLDKSLLPTRFIPPTRVWWIYIGLLGTWLGGG